jgi:hypothetical protein
MGETTFRTNIDHVGNVLIQRVASLPAFDAGEEGRLVLNQTDNKVWINDGTQWSPVGGGSFVTTSDATIDATDSGKIIKDGAADVHTYNLPDIQGNVGEGFTITFIKLSANALTITPELTTTDVINNSTNGVGGGNINNSEATELWSAITLISVIDSGIGKWIILNASGTWTTV